MGRLWLWLTATESGALTLNATSAALFAVQGIFVTRASRTAADAGGVGVVEVPGTQLVVLRASLQLLTVLLWRCCAKSFPLLGPKKIRHLVMARGFFGSFGFTVYYHAIATLPLGDAITLLSLYPISTMVLASVFLGEEMQAVAVAAALFSAAGSVLIARPTFLFDADAAAAAAPLLSNATAAAAGCHGLMCATAEEEEGDADVPWLQTQASGYVAAGMGALLAGVVFTLIRKCKDAHALSLIFAFTMCAIVNDGLLGLFFEVEVWPSREAIFADEATMTACVGVMITGTAAHFLMNYSMRNAPAGISSIVRSSDILWAYAAEVLILKQPVGATALPGASLVLVAITLVGLHKYRSSVSEKGKGEYAAVMQQGGEQGGVGGGEWGDFELEGESDASDESDASGDEGSALVKE